MDGPSASLDRWAEDHRLAHDGPVRYVPKIRLSGVLLAVAAVVAATLLYAAGQAMSGVPRIAAALGVFVVLAGLAYGLAASALDHYRRSRDASELAGAGIASAWVGVAAAVAVAVLAPLFLLAQ